MEAFSAIKGNKTERKHRPSPHDNFSLGLSLSISDVRHNSRGASCVYKRVSIYLPGDDILRFNGAERKSLRMRINLSRGGSFDSATKTRRGGRFAMKKYRVSKGVRDRADLSVKGRLF